VSEGSSIGDYYFFFGGGGVFFGRISGLFYGAVLPEILKTSGEPRNILMYLSSSLHHISSTKVCFISSRIPGSIYVGNEILLVTLLKVTVSNIKPEDGNSRGKLNLFLCFTKHHSPKVYCEVGGMDPCTLYLDT